MFRTVTRPILVYLIRVDMLTQKLFHHYSTRFNVPHHFLMLHKSQELIYTNVKCWKIWHKTVSNEHPRIVGLSVRHIILHENYHPSLKRAISVNTKYAHSNSFFFYFYNAHSNSNLLHLVWHTLSWIVLVLW